MGIRIGIGSLKIGQGSTGVDWSSYWATHKITSVSSETSDFIVPVNIHKGINVTGKVTDRDIYFNGKCKNDFSDVEFTDVDGNVLDSYITNINNVNIEYDDNVPIASHLLANGDILACRNNGVTNVIAISSDNCVTWDVLYNANSVLSFVDSRGYYFITDRTEKVLKRSIDGGKNWVTVYDMSSLAAGVVIDQYNCCEDGDGNLYFGRYQREAVPTALKSIDGGATFTEIFSPTAIPAREQNAPYLVGDMVRPSTANGKIYVCYTAGTTADTDVVDWPTSTFVNKTDGTVVWQLSGFVHFHGLAIDPYTGYLYGEIDGVSGVIRSIDAGATWKCIFKAPQNIRAAGRQIYFGDGYRIFSGSDLDGFALLKTTDDVTLTPLVTNGMNVQGLAGYNGVIYASLVLYGYSTYCQIIKSEDDGDTWQTIWVAPHDETGGFLGYTYFNTPAIIGGELQMFLHNNGAIEPGRLKIGGSNYQAIAFVKIPSLVEDYTLKARGGVTSNSAQTLFLANSISPLLRVKFDEGTGVPADSSASPYSTTIAGTGEWQNEGGRFAGPVLPKITTINKSYDFKGDGYLQVTGSEAFPDKNYTAFCWFKSSTPVGSAVIFCKGLMTGEGWVLKLYTASGGLSFTYGKTGGGTLTVVYSYRLAPSIGLCDGTWHMIGIILTDDSPAKYAFIIDGMILNSNGVLNEFTSLQNDPASSTRLFRIGATTNNANYLTGSISDMQLYSGVLTASQVRSIYEDRPLLATEPIIELI
jgi:hypothetical protein